MQSIFSSSPESYLVLVDNKSDNDSVVKISEYFNSINIKYNKLQEKNVHDFMEHKHKKNCPRVTFILNEKNYGFAGGNNVGLRYILSCYDAKYIWLLNSDCVIDENSLLELLKEAEADEMIGFVGSVSRYYFNRDLIQCYGGGIYYPLLGISKLYKKNKNIKNIARHKKLPIDYIMGVSLFVRVDVIKDIGLLVEDYFLYSEEVDWQYTARKRGWKLSVADKSYVYHKDSASTRLRPYIFFYYINRAAIMFNKKYYGIVIATISAVSLTIISIIRAWPNVKSTWYAMLGIKDGLSWQWKK
jgi:GT2 family glycosyltransferase